MFIKETKRAIHDALCTVGNLIKDQKILYGGGTAKISCAITCANQANRISTLVQYAFRAFAKTLEAVPLALAENSGLSPVDTLAEIKTRQVTANNSALGIDNLNRGIADMKVQNVIETLTSKTQQILLATQLVKMILKIDDIRSPNDASDAA